MPMLRVVALAGQTLVQDSGRGHRGSGVPISGAFDRNSHAAATALVGGTPEDATLEIVGQIAVRASDRMTCAVTGAAAANVQGTTVPMWTALDVPAGGILEVRAGSRGYLAVAGGIRVWPVLGSRSRCLLGAIGPEPVRAGDALPLADPCWAPRAGDFCRPSFAAGPVRVVPGPHLRLPDSSVEVVASSRIGVRVRPGFPLAGARATLPSLGVLPGTIQVLPSGDWVVLGPDAGTMGGYPVAGVVVDADLDRWAQVGTGDRIELVAVEPGAVAPCVPPQVVRASLLGP